MGIDMAVDNEEDMKHSVVKVYGYGNKFDFTTPWQQPKPMYWRGSGFVLKDKQIITNGHVVANHSVIQIRLACDSKRYIAKVKKVGHDCDLALLEVEDEDFWQKAKPLELGSQPKMSDEVSTWGFPLGIEELSVTRGTVSNLAVRHYVHSGVPLLAAQISAPINPGNSGGPVLTNGKVSGVAFQGMTNAQNVNFIIPVDTLNHFLKDGFDSDYKGFPGFLVGIQTIDNPNLTNYLGMKPGQTGVRVTGVHRDSDALGKLQADDVLLKIDGYQIYNDGFVKKDNERIRLSHFITRNNIGDQIEFDILRNGKELKVNCKLNNRYGSHKLVPLIQHDISPTYLSISGIIVQPLSVNFLINMLENRKFPPIKFLDMNQRAAKLGHLKELIFISNVLPTKQTLGYQGMAYNIVHTVNGKTISCMKDVVDAVINNNAPFHQIITEGNQKIIVENLNPQNHKKILKKAAGFEKECSDNLMLFYQKAKDEEKKSNLKYEINENIDGETVLLKKEKHKV